MHNHSFESLLADIPDSETPIAMPAQSTNVVFPDSLDDTNSHMPERTGERAGSIPNTIIDLFTPHTVYSDDPLVDVVRRDERAAYDFIRTVMMFSSLGGLVVVFPCVLFLLVFWRQCGSCDRPLRWWILMHALLQLAQLPVRIVFLVKLQQSRQDGSSLETCVARYTSSPAWRISKNLSLFTYGWFVLGVVWIVNAGKCVACPGIYWINIIVILQSIARAVVAVVCFRILFPHNDDVSADESKAEPATPYEIAALPLMRYSPELFSDPGASCAVCLCEYEAQDMLRKFPCGHYFHQKCAEQWLWRSKKCPLCMAAINKSALKSQCKRD